MKPNKKHKTLLFKIFFVLAIVGVIIIMMTAEMSKYRYFGESDIFNYVAPLVIGVIFVLPFIIHLIKSRKWYRVNQKLNK